MAENLKVGDRVVLIRSSEQGTVVRVDGYLIYVDLDSGLHLTTVAPAIKKIEPNSELGS
jgi:preprotein translocase subunit YajC